MVDANKRAKKKADPVLPPTPPEDFHKKAGTWSTITSAVAAALVAITGLIGALISNIGNDDPPAPLEPLTFQPTSEAPQLAMAPPVSSDQAAPPPSTKQSPPKVVTKKALPPPPVMTSQVQSVPSPPPMPPPPIYVPPSPAFSQDLRIRDQPNQNADTIGILRPGEAYSVGERMGDYYYVVLPKSNTRGFLRAEIVDYLQSQTQHQNQSQGNAPGQQPSQTTKSRKQQPGPRAGPN